MLLLVIANCAIMTSAAIFAAVRVYAIFDRSKMLFLVTSLVGLVNPVLTGYTMLGLESQTQKSVASQAFCGSSPSVKSASCKYPPLVDLHARTLQFWMVTALWTPALTSILMSRLLLDLREASDMDVNNDNDEYISLSKTCSEVMFVTHEVDHKSVASNISPSYC